MAQVCPVVGTTNTVLPPAHPDFDATRPGLVCPVTKATTDHHHHLHKHPGIAVDNSTTTTAAACPALSRIVSQPEGQALDEGICPVVGAVSTVLPPGHPQPRDDDAACPVTNATLGHHRGKVHPHPSLDAAPKGAVCPVVHQAAK